MSGSSLSTLDTKGHEFQRDLAETLRQRLNPVQREKVRIVTAPVGSTLPDISITHLDHPSKPVNIECKVGSSQGGAITWNYDGRTWTVSDQSANGKAVCDRDPLFCDTLAEILSTPVIMDRVRKIMDRHKAYIPELATDTVPFKTVPEVWSMILSEVAAELRDEADGKDGSWKFAIGKRKYWRNLNSAMHGSHFLAIKGQGLLRVNGATFPDDWFLPSPTMLQAPLIDGIVEEAGGDVEARFKRGGRSKGDKGIVQHDRRMFVIGNTQPKKGDGVWVNKLYEAERFDPNHGLLGKGVEYVLTPPEQREVIGYLGEIKSLHGAAKDGKRGWSIVTDFLHTTRGVTFETNLRISEVQIITPINLEVNPTILTNCIVAT